MTLPLKDRLALVSGGGDGIGRACALALARDGAKVCVTDINADTAKATAQTARTQGGDSIGILCDVRKEDHWQQADNAMRAQWGNDEPLRILVNNAGIPPADYSLATMPLDAWRNSIAVHLDGTFLGCRLAMQRMTEGGAVINISSVLALAGGDLCADYSAAKGGIRSLTKALAVEGGPKGIRAVSIHPGYIDTKMPRDAIRARAAKGINPSEDVVVEYLRSRHLLKRLGQPEEVAETVAFFASDAASFLTGLELPVDGGLMARVL